MLAIVFLESDFSVTDDKLKEILTSVAYGMIEQRAMNAEFDVDGMEVVVQTDFQLHSISGKAGVVFCATFWKKYIENEEKVVFLIVTEVNFDLMMAAAPYN